MEFAKRISIFFAVLSAVVLPLAANAAHRGEERIRPQAAEQDEAKAAAAVAVVVGVGLVLMHAPEEETE